MTDTILRAGLGQIDIRDDIEGNLARIREYLAQGRDQGLEVIVFPEGALGGYYGTNFKDPAALDGVAVERSLDAVRQACEETRVAAAVGASRRCESGEITNSLVLFSERGAVVGEYVKTQLTGGDKQCYAPGKALPVFQWRGIRVGLLICFDQRFPEPWRALALQGAQVVLHASNACNPGDEWKILVVEAHIRSRAAENGFFIVSVNRAGKPQNWGSVIFDPQGLEVARAAYDQEELVGAALDLARVNDAFLRERRVDLYEPRSQGS